MYHHGQIQSVGISDTPLFSEPPKTSNWEQITERQKEHYAERIGKRYGDFQVIGVEYDWSRRRQKWTLRCINCGATKTSYNTTDYVKGKSKHCICYHEKQKLLREQRKAESEKFKQKPLIEVYNYSDTAWIGRKVGGYQILEYYEHYGSKHYAYLLECVECGKQKTAACATVMQEKISPCNHVISNNYADPKYIQRRFGNLVVLEYANCYFKVKCDCGTEKWVRPADVMRENGVKTCGSPNCNFHIASMKANSNYMGYHRAKGIKFEIQYADYLTELGYDAKPTKESGDYGVDIIVTDERGKIAIQCKKTNGAAGVDSVQAVYAGGQFYGCNRFEVVCNKGYTSQARKLATVLGVTLTKYDGSDVDKPVNDKNIYWTIDGEERSASEWCKIYGISRSAVNIRMKNGMSLEDAIKTPDRRKSAVVTIGGVEKTLSEWCKEYGVSLPFVQYRINTVGMTPYEALTTPKVHTNGRPQTGGGDTRCNG